MCSFYSVYQSRNNWCDYFWIQLSYTRQVPVSEDNCTLSSGYAAAMDAAVHGNHYGIGRHQDQEETTPSDISERPSVDDVESDTGSTGALETRSLKDHKGNKVPLHVKKADIEKAFVWFFFN